MEHEPLQALPEPPSQGASTGSGEISTQTRRSGKGRLIMIGAGAVLALCLCAMACAATFAGLAAIGANAQESAKEPVQVVLDEFMRAMAARDIEAAHALLSPRAQPQIPVSSLEQLDAAYDHVLFEGYQSLEVYDIQVTFTSNPNPNVAQGQVAVVTATTTYACGCQGTLEATLEKVNGEWRLDGFNVTVPPEMLQP